MLFHITTAQAWEEAKRVGRYRAPSLDTERFIHLSTRTQWPKTANRFFKGQTGLVLLTIDPRKLLGAVRHEAADGDYFPHLYGPLDVDAVVNVATLEPDPNDGSFTEQSVRETHQPR